MADAFLQNIRDLWAARGQFSFSSEQRAENLKEQKKFEKYSIASTAATLLMITIFLFSLFLGFELISYASFALGGLGTVVSSLRWSFIARKEEAPRFSENDKKDLKDLAEKAVQITEGDEKNLFIDIRDNFCDHTDNFLFRLDDALEKFLTYRKEQFFLKSFEKNNDKDKILIIGEPEKVERALSADKEHPVKTM